MKLSIDKMINENNANGNETKGNAKDVFKDLNQYRNIITSRGEIYLCLQKLANANVELKNTIKSNSIKSEQLTGDDQYKHLERKTEKTATDLVTSFHKIFENSKMIFINNNERYRNSSSMDRDLLIMSLELINYISRVYKQKLVNNEASDSQEWSYYAREINITMRLLHLLSVIVNIMNGDNNKAAIGANIRQIDNRDNDQLTKMNERLNNQEEKLKEANKEILTLRNALESTKRELEFLTLCQENGLSKAEYNKIFIENIEATLFKKELETLQKEYLEVDQMNGTLEVKIVNLLNEMNILVSKNVLLEDKVKQFKKSNSEKNLLNSTKLTKNDLLIQMKEQNETINNMAVQNSQLSSLVAELKKENKLCSKSYIIARTAVLEREIQNMKLEHNMQELKMVNSQLEVTICNMERQIEELEMDLCRSGRKSEELLVQLAASETIRISLQFTKNNNEQNLTMFNALVYESEQQTGSIDNVSLLEEISSEIIENEQISVNQELDIFQTDVTDSNRTEIQLFEPLKDEIKSQ